MAKRSMTRKRVRGRKGSHGGGAVLPTSSGIPATPLRRAHDHAVWREYYRAAIYGIIAAQTKTPNPQLVARLAITIADVAVRAELARWAA